MCWDTLKFERSRCVVLELARGPSIQPTRLRLSRTEKGQGRVLPTGFGLSRFAPTVASAGGTVFFGSVRPRDRVGGSTGDRQNVRHSASSQRAEGSELVSARRELPMRVQQHARGATTGPGYAACRQDAAERAGRGSEEIESLRGRPSSSPPRRRRPRAPSPSRGSPRGCFPPTETLILAISPERATRRSPGNPPGRRAVGGRMLRRSAASDARGECPIVERSADRSSAGLGDGLRRPGAVRASTRPDPPV
jgi:hypothetical protein